MDEIYSLIDLGGLQDCLYIPSCPILSVTNNLKNIMIGQKIGSYVVTIDLKSNNKILSFYFIGSCKIISLYKFGK